MKRPFLSTLAFWTAVCSSFLCIQFTFHLALPENSWAAKSSQYAKRQAARNAQIRKQGLVLDRQIQDLERKIQESKAENDRVYRSATSVLEHDPVLRSSSAEPVYQDGVELLPAKRPISQHVDPNGEYPIDVYDPLEGFNRTMYNFNAKFDRYLFLPVVYGYEFITPDYIEDRISNVFSNILDIRNLLNALFQLKFATSGQTTTRLLINTVLGIGGLWDHATTWGFPQHLEDFGQTLGHYGVGNGPYLVLPILGPSNLRDGTGLLVDWAARYFYLYVPLGLDDNVAGASAYTLMNSIDTRHRVDFRYYQTGSPFEYDLVRFLYIKIRQLEIEK